MFAYILSVCVAFLFFGTVYSVMRNLKPNWFDSDDCMLHWVIVGGASMIYPATIIVFMIFLIMFCLKKLVDKISNVILKKVCKK